MLITLLICITVCDENSVHTRVFIVKLHWVKVKIKLEQTLFCL